ncbi:hypothetical protein ACT691_00905 [Vibrio metschnikovii]
MFIAIACASAEIKVLLENAWVKLMAEHSDFGVKKLRKLNSGGRLCVVIPQRLYMVNVPLS